MIGESIKNNILKTGIRLGRKSGATAGLADRLVKQKTARKAPAADKSLMSFDLLYQLSYMSVVAAAGIPRDRIFEKAALLPGASAEYFRRIELTQKRLQYDYARACRIVGDSAKEEVVKALLLRLSTALMSGEPEGAFLTREADSQQENYQNEYNRKLEGLKMWSDAFISLILSSVLIIIISIISTMIWKVSIAFILGMVVVSVGSTAIGTWIIFLMSPREMVTLPKESSREQKIAKRLLWILLPVAGALSLLLIALGVNLGIVMIAASVFFLPIGVYGNRDEKFIAKRDNEVGLFLRSLGSVSAAIGATVKDALERLDLDAIGTLKPNVKRLHTLLSSGIKTRTCWARFIAETGSELVSRSVGMFFDAIDLGGDPQAAGFQASLYAIRIALLRERRKTVSMPFKWLCVAMHVSVTALLVFITEVIMIFGSMVAKAEQSMPRVPGAPAVGAFTSFNYQGLELMHSMVIPLVLIYTLANALAPFIVDGGNKYKIMFNLGITSALSGILLIVLPMIATYLFSAIKI